jgi:hypothetical protein
VKGIEGEKEERTERWIEGNIKGRNRGKERERNKYSVGKFEDFSPI